MKRLASRLRSLTWHVRVMQTPMDIYRYSRLRMRYRKGGAPAPPRAIRVRSLGGASVLCRPTHDVWTLKATFAGEHHLPPAELPPNATIVDLGSNVGYTVAHFAQLYPSARIVGVEMDAANLSLAERNTARFGARVELVHAAVWTSDGVIAYAGEDVDAFRVTDAAEAGHSMSAPSKRLATLFDEREIARVDYLKMDIEGAEAAIFAGPMEWSERVHSMKVEVHPPATIESVRDVLEANGFSCWRDDGHPSCVCAVRTESSSVA